jgi:hypothetical protein
MAQQAAPEKAVFTIGACRSKRGFSGFMRLHGLERLQAEIACNAATVRDNRHFAAAGCARRAAR